MKLDKLAIVFILTLLIGGAALYFSKEKSEQREDQQAGNIYLKTLSQRINDVSSITISTKKSSSNLLLEGDKWVLKEKNNYAADFGKVKKLILDLSEFKTIESKTAKAENYLRLGVQDIQADGDADSTQIDLFDKAGNKLESVIIGKSREAQGPGSSAATYVRKVGDAQSWLVSGSVQLPANSEDWLDKIIVDIKPADIQKVSIKQSNGNQLSIEKASKDDKNFKVMDLPDGAKLKSDSVADGLANGLSNLAMQNVLQRNSFDLGSAKPSVVEFQTFDGITISAKLVEKEQKHYLLLDAQTNVADDKIKQQAVKLGSQFAQWVYEVAEFKAKGMLKTLDDLLEKPKQAEDETQSEKQMEQSD